MKISQVMNICEKGSNTVHIPIQLEKIGNSIHTYALRVAGFFQRFYLSTK